jgi:hypothetical protein
MHEKGWLGPKDVTLHSGEGPIWACTWRRNLIAWSNDKGIRIYDTHSSSRIAAIPRPDHSPRADLYPCTLIWQTDTTLVSAWADYIKVIRVRDRREEARLAREKEKEKASEKGKETDKDSISSVKTTSHNPLAGMSAYVPGFSSTTASVPNQPPVYAEVANILQLDCMISSIVPFLSSPSPLATPSKPADALTYENTTNFLVLSHLTPPTSEDDSSATVQPSQMPELRIIGVSSGEEISSDVLPVSEYERWQCKDYKLVGLFPLSQPSNGSSSTANTTESYFVISPKDVVLVKKRDVADHIAWLCERKRYEEALKVVEKQRLLPSSMIRNHKQYDVSTIGTKFLTHLLEENEYEKAASNADKIFAATDQHAKNWENFVFTYAEKEKLDIVIPYIPVETPTLSKLVYELVLVHFLKTDPPVCRAKTKTETTD